MKRSFASARRLTKRSQALSSAKGLSEITLIVAEIFRPKPKRTPDRWANETRVLPLGEVAEPGPFRCERTPYMIPIMRASVDTRIRQVVGVCATQMAKTDTVSNVIGYRLDDDPIPVIYVAPTRELLEKQIEPRLTSMLKSSAALWAKCAQGKTGSKMLKRVNGTSLRLAWAGSATQLASQAAGLVVMDEIDKMDVDVEGEGSPIELVKARLATFPDSKLLIISTPTEGHVVEERHPVSRLCHWQTADPKSIRSSIWKLWQAGTRFEWAWPCPECGEYFIPHFSTLTWPDKATPTEAKQGARVCCVNCGALIEDSAKREMNDRGRYVAPGQSIARDGTVSGDVPENETHSFFVSGLCSPWRTFGECVADYLDATSSADPDRIKGVMTSVFGEPYRMAADAPEWQQVKKRAGGYLLGEVPKGVEWLTCGVDVQMTRLIAAVRGWGYGLESWLIQFVDVWGDTSQPDTWQRLRELVIERDYAGLTIRKCMVDSGYKPGEPNADHIVYDFCRQMPNLVVPAKGHDRLEKLVYASQIDVRESGKLIKNGLQLWHVDSDRTKSFVHNRLRLPPNADGTWHLPSDVTEDYCQQLVAEARLAELNGRATWLRLRKANHALDCEAMNVAAIHMLGGHMMVRPRADTKPEAGEASPTPSSPSTRTSVNPGARWATSPPASGNFVTNWRK